MVFDSMDFRGRGPWRRSFLRRGDFKYFILEFLKDKPRNGYEIIRDLESLFHGIYSPSPGVIYPTLQLLEEMGYVKATEQEGKKTFTITDEGRQYLAANEAITREIGLNLRGWWKSDARELGRTMHGLGRTLREGLKQASPERLKKIREIVEQARRDIDKALAE